MDDVDVANNNIDKAMGDALKNRSPVDIQLRGSGLCVVCFTTVDAVPCNGEFIIGRFCSTECRDEYETL